MSKKNSPHLTQDGLRNILEYSAETGIFTWRVSRGRVCAGYVAGHQRRDGYVRVKIDDRFYLAHRLAFLFMTGSFPVGEVDHFNGNKSDNRWQNLRDVSHAENGRNRSVPVNNKSGSQGVRWNRHAKRWHAQIYASGKNRYLGYYDTQEAAHAAYARAAEDLGFSPRHIYGAEA